MNLWLWLCCPPSDSVHMQTMQSDHRTHLLNCDRPRLVAVATRGFISVPEEEVNEVHRTMHLKWRTTLSKRFKIEVLFQPVCLFLKKMTYMFNLVSQTQFYTCLWQRLKPCQINTIHFFPLSRHSCYYSLSKLWLNVSCSNWWYHPVIRVLPYLYPAS